MNRTSNPHRGGTPKGQSWTRLAYAVVMAASHGWTYRGDGDPHAPLRDACRIIRDHSRRAATRAEAARLLTLLEAKHG